MPRRGSDSSLARRAASAARRGWRRAPAAASLAALVLLASCGPGLHEHLRRDAQIITPEMLDRVVRLAPVSETAAFHPETLLETDRFSAHLLQFRTAEQRHIHQRHDLTFMVRSGAGDVFVNDRRYAAKPGDVFHIPRNTPHYAVNTGPTPLVAVLIFSPPFDRRDSIPVPRDAASYSADDAPSSQIRKN